MSGNANSSNSTGPAGNVDLAVIGGGVSGLTTAREVLGKRGEWDVRVLEADTRPGGTMKSDRVEGCLCEWGPNGFLTNVPHTLDLAHRLGLGDRLLPADDCAAKRFLWVRGGLRALPMKPAAFLRSDVLTLRGRLRVLLEPFQGGPPADAEDTVSSFARRRIGAEASSVLVDAMVSGIYAGDPGRLSLEAAFPKMARMESEHGSLWKAMAAMRRASKKNGGPMGPGGALTSFDEGMEVLIHALVEELGDRVVTGTRVDRISPDPEGFLIRGKQNGQSFELRARRVVCAVPSFTVAEMIRDEYPSLALPLEEIPYAGITVACLVYRRNQIAHSLDGFGFLVPHGQGPRMLGCIWTGSIFPPHVSGDRVLLRTMVGGRRDPDGVRIEDGPLVDLVHRELDGIVGPVTGKPVEARLYRHPRGIPQYELGHPDRLRTLAGVLDGIPGLHLAGNAYRGIGVNDCIREAETLARTLVESPVPAEAVSS